MRIVHRTLAYLLLALGAVHTSFARCYAELSPEAVWFAGAGLALIFLALLNLAADAAPVARVWLLCRCANIAGLAFAAPAAIAVGEPQGYFGLVLIASLTVASFVCRPPSQSGATPGWSVAATAGVFAVGGLAAAAQLAACIAGGHPWFQIATWAVIAATFGWAAWASIRRVRPSSIAKA